MIVLDIQQRSDEWFEARRGKVTGTKLKNIYIPITKTQQCARHLDAGMSDEDVAALVECGKATVTKAKKQLEELGLESFDSGEKKIGYYELIADRVANDRTEEDPMARGTRLEPEAITRFEGEYKKKVVQVGICHREDNPNIAVSPDGLIAKGKIYPEATEVKCLSSARHLEAYFEKKIPSEYWMQVLQNFIVNDDLKKLYFIFYDPRVVFMDFHVIVVKREAIEKEIKLYHEYQEEVLKEIEELAGSLSA
ncbi:MAG: hypothetical protein DRP02_02260 [Candidatus Gerdarchaeota archaeon]|nr:MAG: hypothetical protein DRP02_02260 [Candidatus Gerdarchaeota archaeon]